MEPVLRAPDDTRLARFARARIAEELGGAPASAPAEPAWTEPAASFVTLRRDDGELQGCIGSLEPRRSLLEDVEHNALAAAFYDPRAEALDLADVARLDVEISILSRMERIPAASRAEAVGALRPGVDGVVLRWRGRQATLLPQVWRHVPKAEAFLRELLLKAGLSEDFWSDDVELLRYTVRTVADRVPHQHALFA